MEKETLAIEMLKEIKKSAKRWFVISIILLIALISSNIAWLIYESQYETITDETQTIEDVDNSQNSSYSQTIR